MTLSALARVLVESFLPDMRQKYVMNNLKASEWYRQYNSFVPVFLRGRPRTLIAHCLERQARAKKYDSTDIVPSTQKGVFTLIKPSGRSHTIDFGIEGEPSCTCKDWKKWKIPCKHFLESSIQIKSGDGTLYHRHIYRALICPVTHVQHVVYIRSLVYGSHQQNRKQK